MTIYVIHGMYDDFPTCDIAFYAVMPLSRASTRGRYSRIEGVTVNPEVTIIEILTGDDRSLRSSCIHHVLMLWSSTLLKGGLNIP